MPSPLPIADRRAQVYETNQGGKLIGIFTGATIPPVLVGTVDTLYVQVQRATALPQLSAEASLGSLRPMRQGSGMGSGQIGTRLGQLHHCCCCCCGLREEERGLRGRGGQVSERLW